jgi:hypothetical protein
MQVKYVVVARIPAEGIEKAGKIDLRLITMIQDLIIKEWPGAMIHLERQDDAPKIRRTRKSKVAPPIISGLDPS